MEIVLNIYEPKGEVHQANLLVAEFTKFAGNCAVFEDYKLYVELFLTTPEIKTHTLVHIRSLHCITPLDGSAEQISACSYHSGKLSLSTLYSPKT